MATRRRNMWGVLPVAMLAGTAAMANGPAEAGTVHAQVPALTVTTEWLASNLGEADLVLLHVGDSAEYSREHIPGARHVPLRSISTTSHDHEKGLMLELPDPDSLRRRLEMLGIGDRSRVVVYYGNDWVSPSTRAILTLQYAGLGANASLLDGGLPEWKKGNRPVTAEVPAAPRPGKLTPRPTEPLIADADFVQAHVNAPGYTIIDARNTIFYDGPVKPASGTYANGRPREPIVPGHVPGAVNIVFETMFDDTNHLLPEAKLRELFATAGVKPNDTLIAYCHIGQQATVVVFAARSLGYDVRLYDGSFQDWKMRKLPVENTRKGN